MGLILAEPGTIVVSLAGESTHSFLGGTEHEEGTGTARNGRVHVRRGSPGLRADGDPAGREGRREGREEDREGRREEGREGREGREEGCQGEGGGREEGRKDRDEGREEGCQVRR